MALTRIQLKFRYPKPKPNPFRYWARGFTRQAIGHGDDHNGPEFILLFHLFDILLLMRHGGAVTQQFGSCNVTPLQEFYNTKICEPLAHYIQKLQYFGQVMRIEK